ncbi:unnamed protein product [Hapterophycus canaliculatus]
MKAPVGVEDHVVLLCQIRALVGDAFVRSILIFPAMSRKVSEFVVSWQLAIHASKARRYGSGAEGRRWYPHKEAISLQTSSLLCRESRTVDEDSNTCTPFFLWKGRSAVDVTDTQA